MKQFKILYIALIGCLFATTSSAHAQGRGSFEVSGQNAVIVGDSLSISLKIDAKGLNVRSVEQIQFKIFVTGERGIVELPSVVYSGNKRRLFDKRDERLANKRPDAAPFYKYRSVRKKEAYSLDYSVMIPYRQWMDTAMITSKQYLRNGRTESQLEPERILARLNLNPKPKEELWTPDPEVYRKMLSFTTPEMESTKRRSEKATLHLKFQSRRSKIVARLGENVSELSKTDTLLNRLVGNEIITFTSLYITGFGAPEGAFASNDQLVKSRTLSIYEYLLTKYLKKEKDITYTEWVAEDWNGLLEYLNNIENDSDKQDMLTIISSTENFDLRKKKMKKERALYRNMSKTLFPELNRTELNLNYDVARLSDSVAKKMLYIYPDFLDQSEMFRVANSYEKGSKEFREVFEIALQQHPNDITAINNLSAAMLYEGSVDEARFVLSKVVDYPECYNNVGTYYYIIGEFDKAKEYFTKAAMAGISQGKSNITLLPKKQKKTIETHSLKPTSN